MDGHRVAGGRQGAGRHGELAHHVRVRVAHFLVQVLHDFRARRVRFHGEPGAGHPVDEISLEHSGVTGDDPAPLFGRQLVRLRQRSQKILDDALNLFLDSRNRLFLHTGGRR